MNPTQFFRLGVSCVTIGLCCMALGCDDDNPTGPAGSGGNAGSGTTGGGGSHQGGDGGDGGSPENPTYTVTVDVSGLDGEAVLSLDPGGELLTIDGDGAHTFATKLDDGTSFSATLMSAPGLQTCTATLVPGTIDGADAQGGAIDCTDHLAFVATDSTPPDYELWATDGTEAGTRKIADANTGGSSNPNWLTDAPGSRVFFTADDGVHGRELWVSDGTQAGTHLVRDIRPGPMSSNINHVHLHRGRIYFSADDSGQNGEVWVSDGTEAGTILAADVSPTSGSYPGYFMTLGDRLLFSADDGVDTALYALEADETTVTRLGPAESDPIVAGVGGRAYFVATEPGFGTELYATDGTTVGTQRVGEVAHGTGSSFPAIVSSLPQTLLFAAQEASMGRELYGTNGTAVSLVADANVGAASSYPYPVAVVNGKALVWLDNATVGTEVWASDGTTAGTMLLADITPGAGGSSGESLAVIGNQALLSIWSSGTYALWLSDGTPTGTTSLISFPQGTRPLDSIGEVGGRHCFGLLEPEHGAEVWCTDGTVTGTVLLRDLCVGTCNALGVSG